MSKRIVKGQVTPDSPLQENLRVLVQKFESVAAFCRQTGVNRQQFNKYLAGAHAPSAKTIAKLSEHFDLSEADFFLDRASFEARLEPGSTPQSNEIQSTLLQRFMQLAQESTSDLKRFLGTYFRYHYSSIYPGRIVRAVTVIYRNKDTVEYLTIERFPMPKEDGSGHYSFLYSGICYMLGNRIFMVDYERRQRNELTMTILMPQNRTPIKYLYGLLSGVASTTTRQPFSGKVVFERRSDDTGVQKEKLRLATVLEPNSSDLSLSVSRYFADGDCNLIVNHE